MMQSGVYSYPGTSRIAYGTAFTEALQRELELVPARRVYVLASGTLARTTDALDRLRGVLGDRCAGVFARMGAHTPRTDVVAAVTAHTPEWLWLSTGIRAVDHAVEDLCSINPKPLSDATSFHALRLLGTGLRAVKANSANLEARLDCQLGSWLSIMGSSAGVHKGASHRIGHVLGGTADV